MKTILYLMIAIMTLSIIAPNYSLFSNTKKELVIQATSSNITSTDLTLSAEIISNRLKSYGNKKFDITIIPEKSQIKLSLNKNWNLEEVKKLIVQKGNLSFYETFNRTELNGVIRDENNLISLFNSNNPNNIDAYIGCSEISKIEKVNEYLNSFNFGEKCKFVWSINAESSEICLYALKFNNAEGPLLERSDIKSFQSKQDKNSKNYSFDIRFKEQAIDLWAYTTRQNLNHSIAIVLDNNVISAPIVKSEIKNGTCSITGNFSENDALFLTAIVNNQELPLNFQIIEE